MKNLNGLPFKRFSYQSPKFSHEHEDGVAQFPPTKFHIRGLIGPHSIYLGESSSIKTRRGGHTSVPVV